MKSLLEYTWGLLMFRVHVVCDAILFLNPYNYHSVYCKVTHHLTSYSTFWLSFDRLISIYENPVLQNFYKPREDSLEMTTR